MFLADIPPRKGQRTVPRYVFTPESIVEIHANSSVHPIHGETHAVSGEVQVEVEDGHIVVDPSPSGYVELPAEELKSGKKLEDRELRRRIDAKQFPTIRYELNDAGGGPESFKLLGTLTFHGVSRQFSEEVTARVDGDTIHVEGEHTFDIREFDVKPPKILTLQVYPEVRVVARLVARRQ